MSDSESTDDHADLNGSVSPSSKGSKGQLIDLFNETMPVDRLLDAIAKFCVFFCSQPYRDGKSASTVMVYFAVVLGISRDGTTFERPSNCTPKLSAFVHTTRLRVLEITLPRFPYPRLGWRARPSEDTGHNQGRVVMPRQQGTGRRTAEPPRVRTHHVKKRWSRLPSRMVFGRTEHPMGQRRVFHDRSTRHRAQSCCSGGSIDSRHVWYNPR